MLTVPAIPIFLTIPVEDIATLLLKRDVGERARRMNYARQTHQTHGAYGGSQPARTAAIDPVCDMKIDPPSAAGSFDHGGAHYYFCGNHCLAKFKMDPAKYLAGVPPAAAAPARNSRQDICTVHEEIVQDIAGSCPKCGVALVINAQIATAATKYTCSTHPEAHSPKPGSRPKCGIAPLAGAGVKENAPELRDRTRRFRVGATLAIPLGYIVTAIYFGVTQSLGLAPHAWIYLELALGAAIALSSVSVISELLRLRRVGL